MTRPGNDDPVARPALYAVTAGVTAPGSVTAPPVAGDAGPVTRAVAVVPVPVAGRAVATGKRCAVRAASAAHELWLHPGRAGHALWHGRPESAAGHFAYMKSREWVPEELTGKKARFVAWAGFAYHVLIAWPLMWVSQAGIWALQAVRAAAVRPLFLLCLAVPVITILFILGII